MTYEGADERLSELEKLAFSAKFEGGAADNHLAFKSLDSERQSLVLRRLTALLAYEAADAKPNVDELAADAGLKKSAFYALLKKWSAQRSLVVLMPYARRAAQKRGTGKKEKPANDVQASIRQILTDEPKHLPDGTIAKRAMELHPGKLSPVTVLRLVRDVRREMALQPNFLKENYGERVLVDAIAIALVIKDDDDPDRLAAVGMVIEETSGLIVGHRVGRVGETWSLEKHAIDDSRHFLWRNMADRLKDAVADLTVVLGEGEAGDVDRDRDTLERNLGSRRVFSKGPRRFGKRIISIFGERLGKIGFKPGRTSAEIIDDPKASSRYFKRLSLHDAAALVHREVEVHNSAILDVLKENGLVGERVGAHMGPMSRALIAAFAEPKRSRSPIN